MIEWPDEVVDAIARRRSVIFIGSGVSANSIGLNNARPPTWEKFLIQALEVCNNPKQHIKKQIKSGDLLSACNLIKDRMDEAWEPYLRQCFVDPQYQPAEIHDHIFQLDSRIVITPNFDKIYDRFALQKSGGTVSVKVYTDNDLVSLLRSNMRFIFKVHGDIDNPGNLIFTRKQYAESRTKYSNVTNIINSLLTSHCFLFIGCGLSDPDIALIMEDLNFLHKSGRPHYMTMPKPINTEIKDLIRDTRNIKILEYRKNDGHRELTESLGELVKQVSTRRDHLAITKNW